METITHLGILPPRPRLLPHLAALLRPLREPSTLESLPAEIIARIAEIATDASIASHDAPRADACCCCALVEGKGHVRGVPKDVQALAGTSRRLRAVLVNAGVFWKLSVGTREDRLFAESVATTDGFLENAKVVAMHLTYTGPRDSPIDVPNLRHALALYPSARDMWVDWSTTKAAPPRPPLPMLPPTQPRLPEYLANLRTLNLNISDRKGHAFNPAASDSASGPAQPLISAHLGHLLPLFASPSLEELELRMHFEDMPITVRKAMRVTGDKFRGVRMERLERLGVNLFFEVNTRKEVSGNWLPVLARILTIFPQISPTLKDIEITLNITFNHSHLFTPSEDEEITIQGLLPTRDQVIATLRSLPSPPTVPFTVQIDSPSPALPITRRLFLTEYVPAAYNDSEEAKLRLPKRMHVSYDEDDDEEDDADDDDDESESDTFSHPDVPERDRQVFGGHDELRYGVNVGAIEDLFVDIAGMERVRAATRAVAAADGEVEGDGPNGLPPLGFPPGFPPFGLGMGIGDMPFVPPGLEEMLFEEMMMSGLV